MLRATRADATRRIRPARHPLEWRVPRPPDHPPSLRQITRRAFDKSPAEPSTNHPLRGCLHAARRGTTSVESGPAVTYLPRIVDAELADLLEAAGAVLVEGPRASGKTATAARAAVSEVLLDVDDNARRLIGADPAAVLGGGTPRLIDEWQLEPSIWNHVRREIDRRGAPGQFILTGSAVPADDAARHTGAGRFVRLRMRPLSLYESGRSSGEISLQRLLDGAEQRAPQSELAIAALAELVSTGGWPGHVGRALPGILRVNRGYLDDIRRTDVSRASGATRDPVKVGRLLRSLARNVATPVTLSRLAADAGSDGDVLKTDTVAEYLDALDRLMVVENQPAWSPHLRSRTDAPADAGPALRRPVAGGRRPASNARPPDRGSRVPRPAVRIPGRPRPAGLRPGRGRAGVPLPGEGRPGGRRRRGGGGRPLGGLRDQAGRALGGRRRPEPAPPPPGAWSRAITARRPPSQ